MAPNIELLAPGGDVDSIKAAIAAGADAVYCGLGRFNARNRAENIDYDQLLGIIHLAHKNGCKVFLTLNIIIVEPEIAPFTTLLNKLCNSGIDGVILQDLGMISLLQHYFPNLPVHGSTQLTTHNRGQIDFLATLGVERVNLSRELSLEEIGELTEHAHLRGVMTEVFVHGSNCLSFSGLCYMSSVLEGKSGNRGRCSQPCRDQYSRTEMGREFPFNLKDNCAYGNLKQIADTGVDSLKIEGRIKKFHYVYTVVESYRQQLDNYLEKLPLKSTNPKLYKVFNREFTSGYLESNIHRNMFIDNPRDNSAHHLAKNFTGEMEQNLEDAKRQLYDEKTEIINSVRQKIEPMSLEKFPLRINLSGEEGTTLLVSVAAGEIVESIKSNATLKSGKEAENTLNFTNLEKLFRSLGDTRFSSVKISLDELAPKLQLPFKELTRIKRTIFSLLNEARDYVAPVSLPRLENKKSHINPSLSVLISSTEDLNLCGDEHHIYFELPCAIGDDGSDIIEMFQKEKRLTPWFPAVIIGDGFNRAVDILDQLKPKGIVTNNSGIAYVAYRRNIPWIAGPKLNLANSYSLLSLKEHFGCTGAFISNELNNYQIKTIKKPADFSLHYSIYHPIDLMTVRQCLFHQVTGCAKKYFDKTCLTSCEKDAVVTMLSGEPLRVVKKKGRYHGVYNDLNFLNTAIVSDITNMFDSFLVDLRNIETATRIPKNKSRMLQYFDKFLRGSDPEAQQLKKLVYPTTDKQYIKGI